METTTIVRIRKGKDKNTYTDDKVHKNSTFQLSGNYLIITEIGDGEKIPHTRVLYNLDNVISWSTREK